MDHVLITYIVCFFAAQKKSSTYGWPVCFLWAPHPLRASLQVQFRPITQPLLCPPICGPSGLVHGLWSAHSARPQKHWSQILSRRSSAQPAPANGPTPVATSTEQFKPKINTTSKIPRPASGQMRFPILYGHLSRVRGPNFDYSNYSCEQRNSFSTIQS